MCAELIFSRWLQIDGTWRGMVGIRHFCRVLRCLEVVYEVHIGRENSLAVVRQTVERDAVWISKFSWVTLRELNFPVSDGSDHLSSDVIFPNF